MSTTTNTNDLPLRETRLMDWRRATDARRLTLRARAIVLVATVSALILFTFVALRPLSSTRLEFISVGPGTAAEASDPLAIQVAHRTLTRLREFAQTLPTANSGNVRDFSDPEDSLDLDESPHQPLVIHVVGSATVKDGRAVMIPPQNDAQSASGLLDVASMLQQLEGSRSNAIVLLDVIDDDNRKIGALPELNAWRFARCLDQQMTKMSESRFAVLLQQSQVALSDEDSAETVSGLTRRFMEAFQDDNDTNQDGTISAAELLEAITAIDQAQHNQRAPRVFTNTTRSSWNQVALVPTVGLPTLESMHSPEAASSETTAAEADRSETAPKNPDQKTADVASESPTDTRSVQELAITAPTLPLAIGMYDSGLQTSQIDFAAEANQKLTELLYVDSLEDDAVAWLATAKVQSAPWDEILWMRTVIKQQVPWPLKKQLIHCRVKANQVAIQPTVRQWFADVWTNAQWKRLDAERTLVSPVRHDDHAYIRGKADEAIRLYDFLSDSAQTIDRAVQLCRTIRLNINQRIAEPVLARTPNDDVICQLLRETIELQAWLDRGQGDAIHDCKRLIESITARQRAIEGRGLAQTEGSVNGSSDRFLETSRVRISRSSLAIRLIRHRDPDSSLERLNSATEHAINVLNNSSSSQDEIVVAAMAFQLEAQRLAVTHDSSTEIDEAQRQTDRWATIVASLADDTRQFASDATSDERQALDQINSRCARIALALGQSTNNRVANDFRFKVMTAGSLAVSDQASIRFAVQPTSESSDAGRLEIEFDDQTVALSLSEETKTAASVELHPIGDRDYRTTATQRYTKHLSKRRKDSELSAEIMLRRLIIPGDGFQPQRTAINLRWITKDNIYRACIPFDLPLPPIAKLGFLANQSTPSGIVDHPPRWTMHANRIEHRYLSIAPIDPATKSVTLRLLGWQEPNLVTPPPMNKSDADQWLSEHAAPTVLASHPGLKLGNGSQVPILFPPQKLDPASAPALIGSLWCEVTDTQREIVQMIDVSPNVYRPGSLIQPLVSYDHASQLISFTLRGASPQLGHGDTHVRVAAIDTVTDQVIASGDAVVGPEQTIQKTLSAAGAVGHPVRLRLTVDEWPSAFVYEFDTDRSHSELAVSDHRAAIEIVQPTSEIVMDPSSSEVKADVWVDVSDSVFRYGSDTVTLGLDLNNDRFLHDDPHASVTLPVGVQFSWSGVDDKGHIGIRSRVAPHRLTVPVGIVKNRRVALAAKLQRGDTVTWSRPLPVVFDAKPPEVKDVDFASPLPAVLGAPADVRVSIDDAGLSGAASVQGGWSIDGGQEFTAAVKPVPATKLGDGRWAITLPTDKLASGVHQMLIQATDRAGNLSQVKAISVPVRTAAELLAAKEDQATVVHGKITYVTIPVAGLKVALKPKPKEKDADSAEKEPAADDQASKFENEVQTNQDGGFEFSGVTAGDYLLSVEGLYRGTNYRKQIDIAVKPPEPATVPTIRID
tara:strand:+ start:33649 stop:38043 length:4395 start_codon:yes stop_codon:yes gene_type:complete